LFLHGSAGRYGADLDLFGLASGLDRARYTPLVVLSERGELATLLESAGVETRFVPLAVLRRRLLAGRGLAETARMLRQSRRRLEALCRERRVAIVHSNTSIVLGGQGVADRAGVPHVMHVREIYSGPGGTNPRLWPLLRRRLLRADAVACVSVAAARQFEPSDRAFLLYSGLGRAHAPSSRDAARATLGLAPDVFVVAAIGRVSDWKGQHVLARALAEPPLADIAAVGVVAGDAAPGQEHHERELLELRDRLRLGDRLRMLGFRDDLGTVLGAADAVAVPSTFADPLPNAALEAAAAGMPVVASATGGLPEIIRDGVTGRLAPPGDAGALAACLRDFAERPDVARGLGEAAARDVRARFPLDRTLEEVQTCYDRLCQLS
jgi:glycosyltransferase involved in cell wall biosynthesis